MGALQIEDAFDLFEEMASYELSPDVVTWSTLMNACACVGQVERAFTVFQHMLDTECSPNTMVKRETQSPPPD